MKPVDPQQRLVRASERAELARLRFVTALDGTRQRLSFDRLKDDALVAAGDKVQEAKETVRQTIRNRPFMVGSVIIGGLAFIFWAPARLMARYGARAAHLFWLNRTLWSPRND